MNDKDVTDYKELVYKFLRPYVKYDEEKYFFDKLNKQGNIEYKSLSEDIKTIDKFLVTLSKEDKELLEDFLLVKITELEDSVNYNIPFLVSIVALSLSIISIFISNNELTKPFSSFFMNILLFLIFICALAALLSRKSRKNSYKNLILVKSIKNRLDVNKSKSNKKSK
ncbi:hypothetical protein [Clostridioides difficile]|uniref:hypothetical protein n=1 Tax=Clostridioides difficile TaxID=1496 RepID=UPI002A908DE0|nr:hypothetical protein [Clostridioides difficile]MDB2797878.1 hypothetical protein [Clostridioides difficile]MDY6690727.1 hypothetical protein [Clostridioides difficile]